MSLTLAFSFSYMIEFAVFLYYIINISDRKYSLKKTIIISVMAYAFMLLCSSIDSAILNALLFIVINFILILLLLSISWYNALFHTLILTFAMVMSEFIPLQLLRAYTYDYYNYAYFTQNRIIFTLISKSLYFIILYPTVIIIKKNKSDRFEYKSIPATYGIIPFMSICIMLALMFLWSKDYSYIKDMPINVLIPVITVLIITLNILVIFDESHRMKSDSELMEMRLLLQRENDMKKYYKSLIQASEDRAILIHDIKNHLNAILTLNSEHSNKEITEYINNLMNTSALRPASIRSDNSFLNALLSGYANRFQNTGIVFNTDIRSNAVNFMSNDEITTLFCNILDNAYEASSKSDTGFIDLIADRIEDMHLTVIKLQNSCSISPVDKRTNLLISTSKPDKKQHGYGMKSIQRIIDKYDGAIDYRYENGIFRLNISLKAC